MTITLTSRSVFSVITKKLVYNECDLRVYLGVYLSQDALTLLAENAELNNEEGRAVAFRRAAAVLKALPVTVTSMTQLRGLPCLGEHSQKIIKVNNNYNSSDLYSTGGAA